MRSRKSKDKKIISKKNIAIIQLRDAIRLYYDKSYISSITLGAAAEEILGKLSDEKYSRQLGRPVKYNYTDDAAFLIANFIPNGDIDLTTLTEEEQEHDDNQRQFISDRNRTRNKLKHKNEGDKEVEFSNFRQVAEDHIAGAIVNYKLFKNELPEDEIILKFSNVKGIS
ncbi:MAG: hypothetical protein IM572_10590 [Chitinophagaceae bacterium]|nr:hypothetical protein [Chitinophagaceae bacterium]MCA6513938.1 hypothetical protein [Chitinophagaceae bacterium]